AIEGPLSTNGALPHRLPQGEGFYARFDAQCEGLGQRALEHVPRAVVDQLGDGAGSDRTHLDDLVADGVEHRFVALKDLGVTADPDRQLAALCAGWPATHRCIK